MAPHQKEHEGVLVEGALAPVATLAVRPADAGCGEDLAQSAKSLPIRQASVRERYRYCTALTATPSYLPSLAATTCFVIVLST
jgi:hypothetical protein